jgi:hypothetical protein
MSGTKITMIGADEAHYLSVSEESARLIDFPDGIPRHMTLSKWHWEVLDKLHKDKGWAKDEIPKLAYEHALDGVTYPDDFEKQLRLSFKLLIKCAMADVMIEKDWSVTNQRF